MHLSDDLGMMKGSFTLHVTIASFTVLIIPKVLEKWMIRLY